MRKFWAVIVGLLVTSVGLHADVISERPAIFSPSEGITWVGKCVDQHPELLWLANSNVRKTEEGQATLIGSYSEQLFGQKFIEFDRTVMTFHCLKLILDGSDQSYEKLTEAQPKDTKLLKESFQILHRQGQDLLHSKWGGLSELEMAQAIETALVLGDMGKSGIAREIFKAYEINMPDHDDFYGAAMQILINHPDLCPSYASLPDNAKELLYKVANLAHYGHISHLEGGPSMFSKLEESTIPFSDPVALSFDLFVHTCDVAGALGHVNNQSSLMYTEPTHKVLQATGEAVRVLSDSRKNELDAYKTYLNMRADWLGLNPNNKCDRVLARIGAMMRLLTQEEGKILRKAFSELEDSDRKRIVLQLDGEQNDEFPRTPTYMPAVLVNLSNNALLGSSKEERLSNAVALGLPFLSRVLEQYKMLLAQCKISPNIPLNFNQMAGIAKTTPERLNDECYIDIEGNVMLSFQPSKLL